MTIPIYAIITALIMLYFGGLWTDQEPVYKTLCFVLGFAGLAIATIHFLGLEQLLP